MRKAISLICLVICLCAILVVPTFAVDKNSDFTTQDCETYGVHIDADNDFVTGVKGTYRVSLKEGAVSGALIIFKDVENCDFDIVSLCALPEYPNVYNTISCSDSNLIYLDSEDVEKIISSNVIIELVSADDITEKPKVPEYIFSIIDFA